MRPTPWPEFLAKLTSDDSPSQWTLGQHVTILGQTGSGKTHLALELAKLRGYTVAIATKPKDELLAPLKKEGYKVARDMRELSRIRRERRILLWPESRTLRSDGHQTKVLQDAFEYFYHTGNRAILADETYYLCHQLGLEQEIVSMLFRGRSLGISLVSMGQRPFHLPLACYSQADHIFFFKEHDKRNRDRLREIGGADAAEVEHIIARLPKYHFLYIHPTTGMLRVSKVQRLVPVRPQPLENPT